MNNLVKLIFFCLGIALFYSCASQQDTAVNRRLQNLSARYNYIYNANLLLNHYQLNLSESHSENYDQLLPVYIAPPAINYLTGNNSAVEIKDLDEIEEKARVIVSEKKISNYVDDAYLLLGKTNFYKGNYYNAAAYFDYVAKAYRSDKNIYLHALNWKTRSYMQLQEVNAAKHLLDSVRVALDSVKKEKGEAFATLAQMSINEESYKEAISYLTQAIKAEKKARNRIRWSYILAQLYEHDQNNEKSLLYYSQVEKSNAPFEMYFNAKLSKIRINDRLNGHISNRKQLLLKLLKDDKNTGFTDQIYYEIAEDYAADDEYKKAEEYYIKSAQESTHNMYQKGRSYLKIADLNIKVLNNYRKAKLYYDSAAQSLPKTYVNYEQVFKKAQNLEYLTDRFKLIAQQDSLQLIAKLPQDEREEFIENLFTAKTSLPERESPRAAMTSRSAHSKTSSAFYYNNQSAINRGFNDFKKQWGNRPLADNWRQSVKSSAQVNQQNVANIGTEVVESTNHLDTAIDRSASALQIEAFKALLPLSNEQLLKSDQQIINAYVEIAGFYQQELEEPEEAIHVYETLLSRYPKNEHLANIYYSLYLAYQNIDISKANDFKNLVLREYPKSVYAKTLLDPDFSSRENELAATINQIYNEIFALYEQKAYTDLIKKVNETNQRFPGHQLQIQYDYLKAIAIGRTEPIDSLLQAFKSITTRYPGDSLISPLIKDHEAYIQANLSSFQQRKIALIDFDPTEPRFIAQNTESPQVIPAQPQLNVDAGKPKPEQPNTSKAISEPKEPVTNTLSTGPAPTPTNDYFSTGESALYYYVISVGQVNVSLSSSRFGIGQFNRGNYTGSNLKHQLLDIGNDQLIYIGNFDHLNMVKEYANEINRQLPNIMKVPAGSYQSFFISKENFDKIKDKETLNKYLEFFNTKIKTNE